MEISILLFSWIIDWFIDDIRFIIFILGWMEVLDEHQKIFRVWFRFSPSKTEWLSNPQTTNSSSVLSMIFEGSALPQRGLTANLRFLLDPPISSHDRNKAQESYLTGVSVLPEIEQILKVVTHFHDISHLETAAHFIWGCPGRLLSTDAKCCGQVSQY